MEVRTTGVPIIGARELRRAADILRRYKQGKQNLERRIIADEDWWKLRQWRQFSDKGNPNDDRPASGWLFNVIMGKHADAVAAYPGPVIRPREPDDRQEAQMLSSIIPCILEQNDFEEVYSDTCWQKMKQGTGVWGVYWDQDKLGGLGDISIRPVNVLNLFWEPGVTDIQRSQNVFYLELEDNETLLAAYPQLAGKLGGSSAVLSRYRTDDAVDLSEKTLVVDWYTKSAWAAGRCCTTASMWAKRSCTRRRTTRSCRRSRGRCGTRRRARRFWCRHRCVRPRVSGGCMTTGSIRSSLTGCFPSRARFAGTAILTSARARRSRSTGWIRPS